MDLQVVDEALAGVRSGFEADGFKLYAQEANDDGSVVVVLEAVSADCLDCLVPDAILNQIIGQAVKTNVPEATEVTLEKKGFEALEAH